LGLPQRPIYANVIVVALQFRGDPVFFETPTFEETPEMFVKPPKIKVSANPGVEVRHSIDSGVMKPVTGDEIQLPNSAAVLVAIQGYHSGKAVTDKATKVFKRVTPGHAQPLPQRTAPGLRCAIFAGSWDAMPNFSSLTPESQFEIPQVGVAPHMEREQIGAQISGYMNIPEDDVYVFELSSDDGSRLYIDGTVVVNNDGLHSLEAKTGAIALAEGAHSIVIEWFNKTGAAALGLRYKTTGAEFRPVPPSWFLH
jgi:hypothetical protein